MMTIKYKELTSHEALDEKQKGVQLWFRDPRLSDSGSIFAGGWAISRDRNIHIDLVYALQLEEYEPKPGEPVYVKDAGEDWSKETREFVFMYGERYMVQSTLGSDIFILVDEVKPFVRGSSDE